MKKTLALLFTAVLCVTAFAGCGKDSGSANTASGYAGTMTELADEIYTVHQDTQLMLGTMPIDLADADDLSMNAGLSSAENVSDIVRSEAMMGQAYSLVLAKVKSADAAEKVAKEMYNNIDQRKWVCVEADTKIAAYSGDTVMFFMVNSEFADTVTTKSMLEAFEKVLGGKATVIE